MARYLFMVIFYFTAVEICIAQAYIGKNKEEIKQLMKENRRDLSLDESSINTVYNLLKYVDHNGTQTLLFVFNENDTCKYYKLMCDYSFLNKIQKDLDEKYSKSEEGLWYFTEGSRKFQVTLKKENWFFSVLTKEIE